jgi:magnesium-transporting ATPase (P-type)
MNPTAVVVVVVVAAVAVVTSIVDLGDRPAVAIAATTATILVGISLLVPLIPPPLVLSITAAV